MTARPRLHRRTLARGAGARRHADSVLGSIFYTPVLILPLVAAERGWSISFAMAGFLGRPVVAGLTSPYVGRAIDRFGGHVVRPWAR